MFLLYPYCPPIIDKSQSSKPLPTLNSWGPVDFRRSSLSRSIIGGKWRFMWDERAPLAQKIFGSRLWRAPIYSDHRSCCKHDDHPYCWPVLHIVATPEKVWRFALWVVGRHWNWNWTWNCQQEVLVITKQGCTDVLRREIRAIWMRISTRSSTAVTTSMKVVTWHITLRHTLTAWMGWNSIEWRWSWLFFLTYLPHRFETLTFMNQIWIQKKERVGCQKL